MTKANILIVEDEPIVAMDVQRRLQHLGYNAPHVATSGEEAVEQARLLAPAPDIILMDIMLPGEIDGIEATARIRQHCTVPVIYLTAYADEEILDRAKITEPFGYILKPFEDRELQTCIEMALYKHKMECRLQEKERWHTTTLNSIGDAVVSTDEDGNVRLINPVAEKLLGIIRTEAVGKPFDEMILLSDEKSGERHSGLVKKGLQQGSMRVQGAILPGANGTAARAVDVTVSSIQADQASAGGVVFVLRDVTQSRQSEEQLHKAFRNLRRTFEETVAALAMTTEKRDPYTAGHQQRVAQLASAIARQLGLEDDHIEGVRVAALLHDLGKMYIPAEILSKPTRLSDLEMSIMKTHSEAGYDILQGISFPWPVAEIVLQHHERLDGSGYPRGLADGQILQEAKIIMVADVVEAMSSHRPYRAALGLDIALGEITKNKGNIYDPLAVDACLHLFQDRDFTFTNV